ALEVGGIDDSRAYHPSRQRDRERLVGVRHRQMMIPSRYGRAHDIDRRRDPVVRNVLDVVRAQVAQVDVPEAAEVEPVAALEVYAAGLLRGQVDGRVDDRIAGGDGRECRRIGSDERAEL